MFSKFPPSKQKTNYHISNSDTPTPSSLCELTCIVHIIVFGPYFCFSSPEHMQEFFLVFTDLSPLMLIYWLEDYLLYDSFYRRHPPSPCIITGKLLKINRCILIKNFMHSEEESRLLHVLWDAQIVSILFIVGLKKSQTK